jgi:formylglycine-generating enzyme required for sulfatase activity
VRAGVLSGLGLLILAGLGVVGAVALSRPANPTVSGREPPPRAEASAGAAPVVRPARPAPLDCTGPDGLTAAEVRRAQEAWAQYLARPVEEAVEIADGVSMTFVLVPPGKFRMGSPPDEDGHGKDETLHEVTLTEPFDLGKMEVTQVQYQALVGKDPSHFHGTDLPVEMVSWEEARDYATELTERRRDTRTYRLPTEAEWEYGCRGGRSSSLPFGVGDGRTLTPRDANVGIHYPGGKADKGPSLETTTRVGSYPANALGLFDMHGNVWEWCTDWYGTGPQGDATNPAGPAEGKVRINRGGCWHFAFVFCRAGNRSGDGPANHRFNVGFRLVRTSPSGGK